MGDSVEREDSGSVGEMPTTPTEQASGGEEWPRITVTCEEKPQIEGTYEVLYAGRRRVNGKPVWAMGTRRVYNLLRGGEEGHWAIAVGVDSPFTGRRVAMSAQCHENKKLPHEMGSWVVWNAEEERWTTDHKGLRLDEAEEFFTPSPVVLRGSPGDDEDDCSGGGKEEDEKRKRKKKKKKKREPAVTPASLGLGISADMTVTRVEPGKPAEVSGLALGDKLVWVKNVNTQQILVVDLPEALYGAAAGNRFIEVGFMRRNVKGSVTLDTPPDEEEVRKLEEEEQKEREEEMLAKTGGYLGRTFSSRSPSRSPSPSPSSSSFSPSPQRQQYHQQQQEQQEQQQEQGGEETLIPKVRSWSDIAKDLPVSNAPAHKIKRRKLFRQLDTSDEKRVQLADLATENRFLELLGGVHHAPLWCVEGAYKVVCPAGSGSLDLRKFRVFLETLRRQFAIFSVFGANGATKIGNAGCQRLVPLLIAWRSGVVNPAQALAEAAGNVSNGSGSGSVVDLVQLSNWAVRQGLETAFDENVLSSPRGRRSRSTSSNGRRGGTGNDSFGRSNSVRSSRSAATTTASTTTPRRGTRTTVVTTTTVRSASRCSSVGRASSVSRSPVSVGRRRAVTPPPVFRQMNPAVRVSPTHRKDRRQQRREEQEQLALLGGDFLAAEDAREWERYAGFVPTGCSVVARMERRNLFNRLDTAGQGQLSPHDVIQGLLDVLDFECSVLTPTAATAIASAHRLVVTHLGTPLGAPVTRKAFRYLLESLRMHFQIYQTLGSECAPLDVPDVKLIEPLLKSWGLRTPPDSVLLLKEASGGLERVPLPTFCSWAIGKALALLSE